MKGTGLSASSSPMGAQSSPPPPPQPKESFVRRYKFMWPLLLTVNLAVGGHFLFPLFDPFNGKKIDFWLEDASLFQSFDFKKNALIVEDSYFHI
ncbi:hypothetical protein CK203_003157 [Vitis vinifera]|uniref:Uncharacterized protein n=1 Tax=Vitis vinifera TaxID=29760 RepID=A0A438K7N3_VITVI|nr:hypothetical protein CK203_003157 [Vitis vinifera]